MSSRHRVDRADHPRVGGGDVGRHAAVDRHGLTRDHPRVGGGDTAQRWQRTSGWPVGTIPAWAGETPNSPARWSRFTEGPSPRGRGRRHPRDGSGSRGRDHPRVGGGDTTRRSRDTFQRRGRDSGVLRAIDHRDHPRVGGGDNIGAGPLRFLRNGPSPAWAGETSGGVRVVAGPSPRGRGRHSALFAISDPGDRAIVSCAFARGTIPAWAGETTIGVATVRIRRVSAGPGTIPAWAGETLLDMSLFTVFVAPVGLGTIPAWAGETARLPTICARRTTRPGPSPRGRGRRAASIDSQGVGGTRDHPRVGGGDRADRAAL